MRRIERTSQFRRDYKREARGRHRESLDVDLVPVLVALANDQSLERRHHDHAHYRPAGSSLPPACQCRPVMRPVAVSTSMRRNAGSEAVPGISLMSPATGTASPAPR